MLSYVTTIPSSWDWAQLCGQAHVCIACAGRSCSSKQWSGGQQPRSSDKADRTRRAKTQETTSCLVLLFAIALERTRLSCTQRKGQRHAEHLQLRGAPLYKAAAPAHEYMLLSTTPCAGLLHKRYSTMHSLMRAGAAAPSFGHHQQLRVWSAYWIERVLTLGAQTGVCVQSVVLTGGPCSGQNMDRYVLSCTCNSSSARPIHLHTSMRCAIQRRSLRASPVSSGGKRFCQCASAKKASASAPCSTCPDVDAVACCCQLKPT